MKKNRMYYISYRAETESGMITSGIFVELKETLVFYGDMIESIILKEDPSLKIKKGSEIQILGIKQLKPKRSLLDKVFDYISSETLLGILFKAPQYQVHYFWNYDGFSYESGYITSTNFKIRTQEDVNKLSEELMRHEVFKGRFSTDMITNLSLVSWEKLWDL